MKVNVLSSFAAGILITTVICGSVYFSTKSEASKTPVKKTVSQVNTNKQNNPTEEEMKNQLASAGYVIQTKEEYNQNMEKSKQAQSKDDAQKSNDNNKESKVVYRAVIQVSEGMTSIDVGRSLVKAHILKDAFKFSKDVEKKGIENNLRPGTYEVESSMSEDQIMNVIFK